MMDRLGKKTIGILGGMGPGATASLFQKIVQLTPAEKDQDHIKIVIYNDPLIPDRTEAILQNIESPTAKIIEGLIFLENAGVDIIAIPCVSSHYYYDEVIAQVNIPVLNIISLTVDHIKNFNSSISNIGVLATIGTYKSKIFEHTLAQSKFKAIIPDLNGQENLMAATYGAKGIKAGNLGGYPKEIIISVANDLIQQGADAIISGCTEIPLVLNPEDIEVPLIDTLSVLAEAVIVRAGLVPNSRE